MSVKNLELPKLSCPFPSAINKNFDITNQHTYMWVKQFKLLPGSEKYEALKSTNLTSLGARCYPNISVDFLKIVSDCLHWIFIFDDYCEQLGLSNQHENLLSLHTQILKILDAEKRDSMISNEPLVLSFADIFRRIKQNLKFKPELESQFLYHIKQYLHALLLEAKYKAQGATPDLEIYIQIRRDGVAVYPFFDFVKIFGGINLELEIFKDPEIQQFEQIAIDIVAWSNDIMGLRRDLKTYEIFNLVMVLRKENNTDLKEAIQRAINMHDGAVINLLNLAAKILSVDANAEPYIRGIYSWLGGHMAWYEESKRYNPMPGKNISLSPHL